MSPFSIRGESGTGKELVARAIYQHSTRASGRFMAVNCAAIPETLLESELFGHEKGSFTGADSRRIGKFEQCSGGTLFLDEVGDMTPLVQSKMLRVLQDQKFERVGGNEPIKTDVRIITATNRDLEEMVAEGTFRPDLFYRLNGFTIKLPALRERADDILLLLEHFLARFNRELGKNVCDISPDALDLLMKYQWPGNVRELQAVVKQALLQATGPVLMPEFFPEDVRHGGRIASSVNLTGEVGRCSEFEGFIDRQLHSGTEDLYAEALAYMERMLLTRVLRNTDGNQSKAAKILGITRGSLRNKIRTLAHHDRSSRGRGGQWRRRRIRRVDLGAMKLQHHRGQAIPLVFQSVVGTFMPGEWQSSRQLDSHLCVAFAGCFPSIHARQARLRHLGLRIRHEARRKSKS